MTNDASHEMWSAPCQAMRQERLAGERLRGSEALQGRKPPWSDGLPLVAGEVSEASKGTRGSLLLPTITDTLRAPQQGSVSLLSYPGV